MDMRFNPWVLRIARLPDGADDCALSNPLAGAHRGGVQMSIQARQPSTVLQLNKSPQATIDADVPHPPAADSPDRAAQRRRQVNATVPPIATARGLITAVTFGILTDAQRLRINRSHEPLPIVVGRLKHAPTQQAHARGQPHPNDKRTPTVNHSTFSAR